MILGKTGVIGLVLALAGALFGAGSVTTAPARGGAATATAQASRSATTAKAGQKYTIPDREEVAALHEWVVDEQKKLETLHKLKLARLETAHFEIVTDWDPREYSFLKNNFEDAYTAISKQFGIPPAENIFVGKLPCFVFTEYKTFEKFTTSFGITGIVPDVQGIYVPASNGMGFMATHKPQADRTSGKLDEMMALWKYVLTHEMTHAFVARYISNRHVVTWLNEGIAEVIASQRIQRDVRLEAQEAAKKHKSLAKLFDDDGKFKDVDMYPVMRTLTEVLIRKDKKAFIQMFDDIKRGKEPAEALKDNYKWTYEQLEAVWRQYVK